MKPVTSRECRVRRVARRIKLAGGDPSDDPKLTFAFDLGYQIGFQSISDAGVSADFNTRYLHVGVGFGLGI